MAFTGAGDLYGLFIKRNRFLSNSLSRTKDTRDECIRSLRHCPVPLVNWRCLLFVSCVCCWAFEIQSLSNQWSVHKVVVSSRVLNFNFLIFKIKWHRTWLSIVWNFIHSVVHFKFIKMESSRKTGITYDESMAEHKCLWDDNYNEKPERFIRILQRWNIRSKFLKQLNRVIDLGVENTGWLTGACPSNRVTSPMRSYSSCTFRRWSASSKAQTDALTSNCWKSSAHVTIFCSFIR